MLLESDIAIGTVVASIRRASVVGVVWSFVAAIESSLRVLVIAVPGFVHSTMLNHGLGI